MNASARQLPGETDRITRAIFEHASLISREQQLEELLRLDAEFARDLAQAQHSSLGLENVRQHRNAQVKSLPAALCAHVDAWAAGAEQYDDMTVVRLRIRA
jgi:hypothetical protein